MKSEKVAGLFPKDEKETTYRSSTEIFEGAQKNVGGIKLHTGEISKPKYVPVSGAEGAYEAVRERCCFHYDSFYAGQGISFEYYEPAYRFGVELAVSPHYSKMLWVDIKDKIEAQWETVNPNTWEEFHISIMHGWNLGQNMNLRKKRAASA